MLEESVKNLGRIIKENDLKSFFKRLSLEAVAAIMFGDPVLAIDVVKDTGSLIAHFPSLIFWDKMKRFLLGTFRDYDEQLRMAEKFNKDNKNYEEYVKKLIYIIDKIDDDKKIDYFAQLTRCYLLADLDEELYFKLVNYINICTSYELAFLREFGYSASSNNNAMISSLYQYGLFVQDHNRIETDSMFVLSDYAKALKQNCLNFDDGLNGQERLSSYDKLDPLNIVKPLNWGTQ